MVFKFIVHIDAYSPNKKILLYFFIFSQVVGDRKGAVFGGLVEAPLRPTNKKYQVLLKSIY